MAGRGAGARRALIVGMSGLRNWWGRQKQTIVAPSTAFSSDGSATTFGVNLAPLRYLTFSFVSLMICVRGLPSIISSCTYILTSLSKTSWRAALRPRMRTSAEPKLPDPTMAIFSDPAAAYPRAPNGRATASAFLNMSVCLVLCELRSDCRWETPRRGDRLVGLWRCCLDLAFYESVGG